jgi:hypothetical protein
MCLTHTSITFVSALQLRTEDLLRALQTLKPPVIVASKYSNDYPHYTKKFAWLM